MFISRLKYLQLAYFSKPVGDRALYRAIQKHKLRTILEIGIGQAARALRMIDLAQRLAPGEAVRYVAIDLFEARGKAQRPGLSLKEAHRLLKATGAQVQLIPGDPASAVVRSANALQNVDLMIVSAEHDDAALEGAWHYVPRMLHAKSLIFREQSVQGETSHRLIDAAQLEALSAAPRRRRAA